VKSLLISSFAGALVLTSCGQTTAPTVPGGTAVSSPAVSPSQTQPAATNGVLMTTSTSAAEYHLAVLSAQGRVLRSTSAKIPTAAGHLPRFSVAGADVFYLDGDTDLRVLKADGSSTLVRHVPGSKTDRTVFSVSPDKHRVAYVVIHIQTDGTNGCNYPQIADNCAITITVRLRVGNLDGTGDHEIFSGSTSEYPVGWQNGALLIAVGPAIIQNNGELNPYFASEYRRVSSTDGTRLSSTAQACPEPGSSLTGPYTQAGTACVRGSVVQRVDWQGSLTALGDVAPANSAAAALSPGGSRAAAAGFGTGGLKPDLLMVSAGKVTKTGVAGFPAGWFSESQLLYATQPLGATSDVAILDLNTGKSTPVNLGNLNGTVDPYAPFFTNLAE
jgi:hypothetical protein